MNAPIDFNASTPQGAALSHAVELFLEGQKLDMSVLAKRMGIGRATLYRWVGDRDQLLVELMWALNQHMVGHLLSTAPRRGKKRIEHMVCGLIDGIVSSEPYRIFLQHEGIAGLSLITSQQHLHGRSVAQMQQLIEAEHKAGNYTPPADSATLAEAAVALGEYFLYAQFIVAGFVPKSEEAKKAVLLLLRENPKKGPKRMPSAK